MTWFTDAFNFFICWNIRLGGGRRVERILATLDEAASDTVVLTEFRNNENGDAISIHLKAQGYEYQTRSSTVSGAYAVLIASKFPFQALDIVKVLAGEGARCAAAQFNGINVFGLYFAQGKAKAPLFEFMLALPPEYHETATILIGDYNTLDEHGSTIWGTHYMDQLKSAGWIDGWCHFLRKEPGFTWFSNIGNGFRIDHAFVSKAALSRLKAVEYLHDPRLQKVSDHSALICEITDN